MPDPSLLSGSSRPPRSGGQAKQLVILLHGWGADGANLIDLADLFFPALPDAFFVAPNAPYACEANPYGYQWFSLMDRQPQHMLNGARQAAEVINRFIDEQSAALGIKDAPVILVGFSQGTMAALHVALRRTPAVAAVVGFSGALIAPDVIKTEIVARPPVCLIHGEADDVVPFAALKAAGDALAAHGVPVESHSRPFLGHSIDMEGAKIAAEFMKKTLESEQRLRAG